jgi:RNA polymerase sigma-70 factor, ECF subfamily
MSYRGGANRPLDLICAACQDRATALNRNRVGFIPSGFISSGTQYAGNKMPATPVNTQGSEEGDVLEPQDRVRFEQVMLPHLNSAANLARWLLRNRADSEDVVQEAMLRAYRFFDRFHGGDARAWLLQIVRNSCYTWLEKNRPAELMIEFNEEVHQQASISPETFVAQADDRKRLMRALESLPARAREVLVLRELEGCSYKEIGEIAGIPIGTVMSTLARARERLQRALTATVAKETP